MRGFLPYGPCIPLLISSYLPALTWGWTLMIEVTSVPSRSAVIKDPSSWSLAYALTANAGHTPHEILTRCIFCTAFTLCIAEWVSKKKKKRTNEEAIKKKKNHTTNRQKKKKKRWSLERHLKKRLEHLTVMEEDTFPVSGKGWPEAKLSSS